MVNDTLYGIVQLAHLKGDSKLLSRDNFRLQVSKDVDPVKDLFLFPEGTQDYAKKNVLDVHIPIDNIDLRIHIASYPTPELIYERELHVSMDFGPRDQQGVRYPVLHLREGTRFLETRSNRTFHYWLAVFLGPKITRLVR
jgi:hypothetical protein